MACNRFSRWMLPALLTVLALMLAACGTSATPAASQRVAGEAAMEAPAAESFSANDAVANEPSAPGANSDAATTNLEAATQNRVIIYTGSVDLRVADVMTAVDDITALAAQYGGFVAGSELHESQSRLQGSVTIRVAAENYQAAMNDLQTLGKTLRQETGSQDVTAEYVDLQARKANLEVTEAALQKMLDTDMTRQKLDDVLKVQRELTTVRGDIESLAGQLRYLENMSSLATITVNLTPEVQPEPDIEVLGWQPGRTVQEAWSTLISALQNLGDTLIWGAICGIPALIILLIPLALARWVYLKRRKRRDAAILSAQKQPEFPADTDESE